MMHARIVLTASTFSKTSFVFIRIRHRRLRLPFTCSMGWRVEDWQIEIVVVLGLGEAAASTSVGRLARYGLHG